MPYSFSSELGTRTVPIDVRSMMDPSWDEPTSTTTRLRRPDCTIRGAGECDSASPTSTAARAAAVSRARYLARRACRAMFESGGNHGASCCSARQRRGCASATAFGRQADRTASGEAATAHLAPDPCAIWADAMDS